MKTLPILTAAIAIALPPLALTAPESSGKKRAGGGPENPELKFKPAPPRVLTPQEEIKTFKLPPGFHAEVVASEPMIQSPIAVSWDDQGRMYVCEMRGYMHDMDGAGENEPLGRISRLEDTNGDGIYDKATVFVDKLVMPRAVMAIGDGALVAEPPNLTFYHDTNGDGVADKSEVIADKFGSRGGQPEHMANSPTWMMDNWIWANGYGFRHRFAQGKWSTEATNGFGQWGRTQDDWGRQYFNYNSDLLRVDLVSPGFYARNPRMAEKGAINFQAMKDQTTWPAAPTPGVNRGYEGRTLRDDGTLRSTTATCGAGIYRGDLFPAEYRGNAFVPEPAGLLVKRLVLTDNNGEVTAKNAYNGSEFLTSTDERFRPVNCYTGPDGALYVVDMARGVIQHKAFLTYYLAANIEDRKLEQPFTLGRIYRIVPDGAKPKAVKLPRESAAIVPLLAHANGWVRDTAQRVLIERGDAAVAPAVKQIAASGATPQARVQALWTLEGLNALSPDVLTARLRDADPKVRQAAVRLADRTLAPELMKIANDPSGEVRMMLAFKLSEMPGTDAALVTLLKEGGSPYIDDGIVSGLTGRELEFLETLAKQPPADRDRIGASGIVAELANCVMRERRPQRIARLIDLAAAQSASLQLALLDGMTGKPAAKKQKAATIKPVQLEAAPPALARLSATTDGKLKAALAKLDAELVWPGKPGYVAPPPVAPLTKEQQALFDKGKATYAAICAACHQPTGTGLANLAPPLVDSEWLLGEPDRPIRIVLHGLTGPIDVAGTKWSLEMPGLAVLSDEDIAGVLTFARREWENSAPPVAPADVAKVRAATQGRAKAWSADELKKPAK
jgi:mono/diheme cytochrome c family protein/glucose/arabinose dehydrogenase